MEYHSMGKEVLRGTIHFADLTNNEDAARVAALMNAEDARIAHETQGAIDSATTQKD